MDSNKHCYFHWHTNNHSLRVGLKPEKRIGEALGQGLGSLFIKGQRVYSLGFAGPTGLCCNSLTLPLKPKSSHRQPITKARGCIPIKLSIQKQAVRGQSLLTPIVILAHQPSDSPFFVGLILTLLSVTYRELYP